MDVTLRVVGYALEDLWRDWRRFPTPQCGVSEGNTVFSDNNQETALGRESRHLWRCGKLDVVVAW